MAQSDTIRYEPKLADIAMFRICKQGVVGSIPIVSTSNRPDLRALAVPLTGWLTEHGLETRPHRPDVATRSAGPELGIEF